jgi:hypothetical protein
VAHQDTNRGASRSKGIRFGGEELGPEQITRIREIVRRRHGAPRREVSRRVCRAFDWRRTNGELRIRACLDLLVRLDARGLVRLPPPRTALARKAQRRAPVGEAFLVPPPPLKAGDVPLGEVRVRPIRQGELPHWREAMARFHYLGDGRIVGEVLRYVAESEGRWVALLGWGAAVLKSRHREAWIGWDEKTKYRRLSFVADNVRFLILPWVEVQNLASVVLSRTLRRLSADWEQYYDHPILLAETFVDPARFRGTCYRASNWIYLGETRGVGRKGVGFEEHGKKKGLFVYPVQRRARETLAAPLPSPQISRRSPMSQPAIDVSRLPLQGEGGLIEVLSGITDPRSRRGIRHPFESVLALAVMAALCGMRSYEAVAEWAGDVSKDLLRELRCWCWRAPSEPTFRRVLQAVDANEVDEKVGKWLEGLSKGKAVALDGKTLRGSRDGDAPARHLLAAITHDEGVVVAQQEVDEKTNEIPGAKPLLEPLDLEGSTVTADAMHTQTDLARFLVEEKKAHYVLIAKDNQPTLREDIEVLDWGRFPPSG